MIRSMTALVNHKVFEGYVLTPESAPLPVRRFAPFGEPEQAGGNNDQQDGKEDRQIADVEFTAPSAHMSASLGRQEPQISQI